MPNDMNLTETLRREMTARASTVSTATVWTLSGLVLAACGGGGGGGGGGGTPPATTLTLTSRNAANTADLDPAQTIITAADVMAKTGRMVIEDSASGDTPTGMFAVASNRGNGDDTDLGFAGNFTFDYIPGNDFVTWTYNVVTNQLPDDGGQTIERITFTFTSTAGTTNRQRTSADLEFTITHRPDTSKVNTNLMSTEPEDHAAFTITQAEIDATTNSNIEATGTITSAATIGNAPPTANAAPTGEYTVTSSRGVSQGGGDGGRYGAFTVNDADGTWTYNIDPTLLPTARPGETTVTEILTIGFAPGVGFNAPDPIRLTFTIDRPENVAPEFTGTAPTGTITETANNNNEPEGKTTSGTFTASDANGDTLFYSARVDGSSGNYDDSAVGMYGNLTITNNRWTYQLGATPDQQGRLDAVTFGSGVRNPDRFEIIVIDKNGGMDTTTLTINVNGANEGGGGGNPAPFGGNPTPQAFLYQGDNILPTFTYNAAANTVSGDDLGGGLTRAHLDAYQIRVPEVRFSVDSAGLISIAPFDVVASPFTLTFNYADGSTTILDVSGYTLRFTGVTRVTAASLNEMNLLDSVDATAITVRLTEIDPEYGRASVAGTATPQNDGSIRVDFPDVVYDRPDGGTFSIPYPPSYFNPPEDSVNNDPNAPDLVPTYDPEFIVITPTTPNPTVRHAEVTAADGTVNNTGDVLTANIDGYLAYDSTNNLPGTPRATGYQWYMDGTAISGATSATYTPTAAGSYYVVVDVQITDGVKTYDISIPTQTYTITAGGGGGGGGGGGTQAFLYQGENILPAFTYSAAADSASLGGSRIEYGAYTFMVPEVPVTVDQAGRITIAPFDMVASPFTITSNYSDGSTAILYVSNFTLRFPGVNSVTAASLNSMDLLDSVRATAITVRVTGTEPGHGTQSATGTATPQNDGSIRVEFPELVYPGNLSVSYGPYYFNAPEGSDNNDSYTPDLVPSYDPTFTVITPTTSNPTVRHAAVTAADGTVNNTGDVLTANIDGYLAYDTANNIPGTPRATGYQWYMDGTAISGATSATYTPTAAGSYHVVVDVQITNGANTYDISIPTQTYTITAGGGGADEPSSITLGGVTFTAEATAAIEKLRLVLELQSSAVTDPVTFLHFDRDPSNTGLQRAQINFSATTQASGFDIDTTQSEVVTAWNSLMIDYDGDSSTPMVRMDNIISAAITQPLSVSFVDAIRASDDSTYFNDYTDSNGDSFFRFRTVTGEGSLANWDAAGESIRIGYSGGPSALRPGGHGDLDITIPGGGFADDSGFVDDYDFGSGADDHAPAVDII